MKLLFDQNLSPRLVNLLVNEYPGSAHVRDAGLSAASDQDIWNYSAKATFVIVSKDSDFQQRALLYGHPPKVVWVRLGNCTTASVAELLRTSMADLLDFESDPIASFLVLA